MTITANRCRLSRIVPCLPLCLISPAVLPDHAAPGGPGVEEILVEASSAAMALEIAEAARIPGGVTVVDMDRLRRQSVRNLADTLRYVPGMLASSNSGGDGIFITSRGSNLDATNYDSNGVKLLQDGLPVTTADGNNHNRIIDPLSARSATVARGANAMRFGASTLGGAINFITPTGRNHDGVSLRLDGGSHDLAAGRLTAGGASDAVDGLLTVEKRDWEGFRRHSSEEREGIYANLGWKVDEGLNTRIYAAWVDNDMYLPGALTREEFRRDQTQANPAALTGNFQKNVESWRLANRTEWRLNEHQRIEFGASLEEQSLIHPIVDVRVDVDGPGPMPPRSVFSLLIDSDHRDLGGMFRFHQVLDNHQLLFGVNYGKNDVEGAHYRHDGGQIVARSADIDNSAETWEWFVQDRWQLHDALELTLAAQLVNASRTVESVSAGDGTLTRADDTYRSVNPRVGLMWNLTDNSALYANLSRLYEPPTNFQLEDEESGTGEELDAMHGTVMEIGTRGGRALSGGGSWQWDLSVYYALIRDEILSRDDPGAPGTSLSANVDETIHAGVEALIAGQFAVARDLSLEPTLSLTYNHFRFDDDPDYGDNDLPAAPDLAVSGELMLRHASGYYGGPVIDWVGDRWTDFSNTYRVGDYFLLGLRGGFEADRWLVFAELENVLEEDYVANHSVRDIASVSDRLLNPGVPLSLYLGVEVSF